MPNFMSGFQGEEPVPNMPFRGPPYYRGDMPSRAQMLRVGMQMPTSPPPRIGVMLQEMDKIPSPVLDGYGPPPSGFVGPMPAAMDAPAEPPLFGKPADVIEPMPLPLPPIPVGVSRPSPRVGLTPADMMQARPYSGYLQPSAEDRAIVPHPANNTDPGAMYVTGSHGVTRYGPKSFQGDMTDVQFDPSSRFGFQQMMQARELEGRVREAEARNNGALAAGTQKMLAEQKLQMLREGIPEAEAARILAGLEAVATPGNKGPLTATSSLASLPALNRLMEQAGLQAREGQSDFTPRLNPMALASGMAGNAILQTPMNVQSIIARMRQSNVPEATIRRELENFAAREQAGAKFQGLLLGGGDVGEWWAGRQPLLPYFGQQGAEDAMRRSELVRRLLEGF